MKTSYLKILVNLVLFICLWFLADFAFTCYLLHKCDDFTLDLDTFKSVHNLKTYDEFRKFRPLRHVLAENPTKKPIMLFGCSFAFGYSLSPEETFAYKLSKLTNRSVYNYSDNNLGIQYFPYILKNYADKNIQPEYIIYVLIEDHYNRLYRTTFGVTEPIVDVKYTILNDELSEVKPKRNYIYAFPLQRFLATKYNYLVRYESDPKPTVEYGDMHFKLARKIAKKKYPNAKIVILKYFDDKDYFYFKEKMKIDKDVIIINTKDLVGRDLNHEEDFAKDKHHPSGHAWDLITPALVKKLGL